MGVDDLKGKLAAIAEQAKMNAAHGEANAENTLRDKAAAEKAAEVGKIDQEHGEALEANKLFDQATANITDANDTIKGVDEALAVSDLDPDSALQYKGLRDEAFVKKGEFEAVKEQVTGVKKEIVELDAKPEGIADTENKTEVAESPAEKLGAIVTEASKFAKQIDETPYDKLEATQEKMANLKSQRENILAQGVAYMEAGVATGEDVSKDLWKVSKILVDLEGAESVLFMKMSGSDERGFSSVESQKANRNVKAERAALEIQSELGANEVAQVLKMVELSAKAVEARPGRGGDPFKVKVEILTDLVNKRGGMPNRMSPEGIQVFEKALDSIKKDPNYTEKVRPDDMRVLKSMLGHYKRRAAERRENT